MSPQEMSSTARISRRLLTILAAIVLIAFALIEILPFIFTVANSFKCLPAVAAQPQAIIPVPPFGIACRTEEGTVLSAEEMTGPVTFNPSTAGYDNVFAQNLGRWLFNTAFVSVIVTITHLIFDSLAGYALARIKFFGSRFFFYLVLGVMMIPGIVLIIPRFIILKQLNMLDSYQGLIIPLATTPFGIFLMKQFFEAIPGEIEEAAMVDGANRFVMFFRVILPMATPALTALAIFSFQGMWNNFLDVLIVIQRNTDLWTLPLGLASLRGQFGSTLEWNTFLAGSVITTVPLAIIFFVFQRYFVEGISYTGLKG
jgi:multiple sugar transport system permease protein